MSQGISYFGIAFTDFIGDAVISKSISSNTARFTPCNADLLTQGCTYCSSASVCLGCSTAENYVFLSANSSCIAAPGYYLLWVSATSNSVEACNSSIPGCLTCSSGTVCTECDVLANY